MPFGMGSILGGIRGGLGAGAANLIGRAKVMGVTGASSWGKTIAHDLTRYAGLGMGRMGKMGNVGLSATMGAIGGGMYGAFADDTSVLGGALGGAALGLGGMAGAGLGARGLRSYGGFRRAGMGMGQAAGQALGVMGDVSAAYIGSAYNRAYNPVASSLKGFMGGLRGR